MSTNVSVMWFGNHMNPDTVYFTVYVVTKTCGLQDPSEFGTSKLTTLTKDESMFFNVPSLRPHKMPPKCRGTGNKVCSMKRKTVTVNAKGIHDVHEKVLGTLTGLLQYVFQRLALENKLCSYLQRIGSNNSASVYSE